MIPGRAAENIGERSPLFYWVRLLHKTRIQFNHCYGNCQTTTEYLSPLQMSPMSATQGIGRGENTVGMYPMFYLIDILERKATPQASLAKPIFDILEKTAAGL